MESTRGNTHSVTFFPPGNVFFGSMISTMHPLTTNTAAVLLNAHRLETCATGNLCYVGRQRYMRKLKVCQRRRRSHWPTVRLPTWIRAVPRMPGVNTLSASSSVISAS